MNPAVFPQLEPLSFPASWRQTRTVVCAFSSAVVAVE